MNWVKLKFSLIDPKPQQAVYRRKKAPQSHDLGLFVKLSEINSV